MELEVVQICLFLCVCKGNTGAIRELEASNIVFYLFSDTMDKWDQDKLEEVIEKKHGEKEKSMPKTEIVSTIKCPDNDLTEMLNYVE